jgi:hypothetical protein
MSTMRKDSFEGELPVKRKESSGRASSFDFYIS